MLEDDLENNLGDKMLVRGVLEQGISVQYKGVSLSDLRTYNVTNVTGLKRKYQVHQDGKFSQIFDNLDDAVDKFFELKEKLAK